MSLYYDNAVQSFNKIKQRKADVLPKYMLSTSQLRSSSEETPRCTRISAVLTLEAAIVMPLLTYLFVIILFLFRVMQVELAVQDSLNLTARQMAVCCVDEENKITGIAVAKGLFTKEMSDDKQISEYITGGCVGVSLQKSKIAGEEINLRANYEVKLPFQVFGILGFDMEQRADCRKWSGWKEATGEDSDDPWVYIAQNGTVYHMTKSCTHIKLSIQSASIGTVSTLRNEYGGKYYRCERCVSKSQQTGLVYITDQGDRYHSDLNCSGLRRTILMVRLSEAGNRKKCSRCGNSQ